MDAIRGSSVGRALNFEDLRRRGCSPEEFEPIDLVDGVVVVSEKVRAEKRRRYASKRPSSQHRPAGTFKISKTFELFKTFQKKTPFPFQ